jgi:hypothetical protein
MVNTIGTACYNRVLVCILLKQITRNLLLKLVNQDAYKLHSTS